MEEVGLPFRATRDFDIVLCVEALNTDFVIRFWDFIRQGGYKIKVRDNGTKCFYRFNLPEDSSYPTMIELFSRRPDILQIGEPGFIVPVSVDDEIASLSAILLNEDYYAFIHSEKRILSGCSIVAPQALIPLKARAWMDLSSRKAGGESIDSSSISKHKNDVFRLYQILDPRWHSSIPAGVKEDMKVFLTIMENEEINLKQLGITGVTKSEVIRSLMTIYCD